MIPDDEHTMDDPLAPARGCINAIGISLGGIVAILLIAGACALLSGCATDKGLKPPPAEQGVVTIGVNMPTAKSCVPDNMPATPPWAATPAKLKGAAAADDRYQMLSAFFLQAWPWIAKADPVIRGCR